LVWSCTQELSSARWLQKKTPKEEPPTVSREWTERYETLRAGVLECGSRPPGLALFIHQGMPAWMAAWEKMPAPAPRGDIPKIASSRLPVGLRGQVTELVVRLILAAEKGIAS